MPDTAWTANLLESSWGMSLFRQVEKEIYFARFMGTEANNIIQIKDELRNAAGDDITFGLLVNLKGSGITGDATLEGNEEAMVTFDQNVTIDQIRNAVLSRGRLNDKASRISFRKEARGLLAIWLAEYIDEDCFDTLNASPTVTLRDDTLGAGSFDFSSTFKSGLAAADVITTVGVSVLRKLAKEPYNSIYESGSELPIRPVTVDGKKYWVLIVSEEVRFDLMQDSTFAQAHREARDRGKENPIFSGADLIWDGVVIHSHQQITSFTDGGGASVYGSFNLFLGAQAGIFARATQPLWDEKKFDFGNKYGIAAGQIYGFAKTKFNSEDFATIIYSTARTQLSA